MDTLGPKPRRGMSFEGTESTRTTAFGACPSSGHDRLTRTTARSFADGARILVNRTQRVVIAYKPSTDSTLGRPNEKESRPEVGCIDTESERLTRMRLVANGNTQATSSDPHHDSGEELMTQIVSAQKPLYSYIRTLVGPTNDVDDILQEVNLVLWRKGHEFDGRGRFLAWACHIAYVQVLAHCQRRRREKQVYFDERVLNELAQYVSWEVERIDARLEALHDCLGKLSPKLRRMILSRYEAGGSVHKVAGELDRPVGSVRVALHRIRLLLADCIGRTLEGGKGAWKIAIAIVRSTGCSSIWWTGR
jgi:RNA polymerase sigma-70 factor (ECF subfamily)